MIIIKNSLVRQQTEKKKHDGDDRMKAVVDGKKSSVPSARARPRTYYYIHTLTRVHSSVGLMEYARVQQMERKKPVSTAFPDDFVRYSS